MSHSGGKRMSPFKKMGNKPTLVLQTSASGHSTEQKIRPPQRTKQNLQGFEGNQSSVSSKEESSTGFLANKQFTF